MYYDYAESILDKENFEKFSKYINMAFSLKKFGTIYFYGTGSNGKSTLVNKMNDSYPVMFGRTGNVGVSIYDDGDTDTVGILPVSDEGSAIIITWIIPEGVSSDRIIYFNKKFNEIS